MKIVEAHIHLLKIPFRFSFGHFLKLRVFSDSIVVALTTDGGLRGYGEGVARSYVTGETVKRSVRHIKSGLLPAVLRREIDGIDVANAGYEVLSRIHGMLPIRAGGGVVAWNASRTSVELAMIDCLLKHQKVPLGRVLPPKTGVVTYTAVFSSGRLQDAIELAGRSKQQGIKYVKIKVGKGNDRERIAAVRDIMGPSVSIRLDANAAFNVKKAIRFIDSVKEFNIDCIEQPVPRGDPRRLASVRAASPIAVMADESIVTQEDARVLLDCGACDYFNLRVAKCGGIYDTIEIAETARKRGVKVQLGCMVGETAILSAAGRHVAAYLPDVRFVEGSYSTHLLLEDIAQETVAFGHGGEAAVLAGSGLGVNIDEYLLNKYTRTLIRVA